MLKTASHKAAEALAEFLKLESAGGILLGGAAVLAMVLANSPMASVYEGILDLQLTVTLGGFGVDKPLASGCCDCGSWMPRASNCI